MRRRWAYDRDLFLEADVVGGGADAQLDMIRLDRETVRGFIPVGKIAGVEHEGDGNGLP